MKESGKQTSSLANSIDNADYGNHVHMIHKRFYSERMSRGQGGIIVSAKNVYRSFGRALHATQDTLQSSQGRLQLRMQTSGGLSMSGQNERGVRGELLAIMKDIQDLVSTDFSSPSVSSQQKLFDTMRQVGQQQIIELRTQTKFSSPKLQTVTGVASLYIPCKMPRPSRYQRVPKNTRAIQPKQTDLETITRVTHGEDLPLGTARTMSWDAIAVKCKSLSRSIEDVIAFDIPAPS